MLIDCERCAVRQLACQDCVVGVLLGHDTSEGPVDLDATERRALDVLADANLVPRLQLVPVARGRGRPRGEVRRRHAS